MKEDSFDEQDQEWMKKLKDAREQPVPEDKLKNFSDNVTKRIRAGQQPKPFLGIMTPVLAAGFALLVIFLLVWRHEPDVQKVPAPAAALSAIDTYNEAELAAEIEALKELGVWSDADDVLAGVSMEDHLIDLEIAFDIESVNGMILPAPSA